MFHKTTFHCLLGKKFPKHMKESTKRSVLFYNFHRRTKLPILSLGPLYQFQKLSRSFSDKGKYENDKLSQNIHLLYLEKNCSRLPHPQVKMDDPCSSLMDLQYFGKFQDLNTLSLYIEHRKPVTYGITSLSALGPQSYCRGWVWDTPPAPFSSLL